MVKPNGRVAIMSEASHVGVPVHRRIRAVTAFASTALLIVSCATTVQGKPVSIFADPFSVAGMPAVNGDTGLRPDAVGPSRVVIGTDGGDADEFGRNAVSDIEEFWESAYGQTFDGEFTPVDRVYSWDSDGENTEFCGGDTLGLVNAGYCFDDNTIGWDRGELMPSLREANDDMAVSMVLAHEYGHAIQHQSGITDEQTPTLVSEQQADCLAGVYLRWVAEGSSPRFTLSTADGLNNLLAAMIAFRDPLLQRGDPDADEDPHGSAFERVSAFQFGFTDGASSCAAVDAEEIAQRRGDLPVLLQRNESGELEITEDSVRDVVDTMNVAFAPKQPPELSFDTSILKDCPETRSDDPAVYCQSNDTIVVDLPALQKLGAAPDDDQRGLASGDNTGYSVVVSRYVMALQHDRGVTLDNAVAALRTACLTGVATAKMTSAINTPGGNTIALTAGDVDEAVSGLLVNGYVASDVNGETVPSGFSRIDAYRIGLLGDEERCFRRFA
jgi:predicted metalloprotease